MTISAKKPRFASVCSGIGAPEKAWSSLGWEPQFFSEIEPFPCAVLAHHYPDVPNLGDMEAISAETIRRFSPDVVVAGTPCQSFSVAGLRKGMADPRGNLALGYIELLGELCAPRMVWENVPGVLSSWTDDSPCPADAESFRAADEAERARQTLSAGGYDVGSEISLGDFEEVEQTNDFDQFSAALVERGYSLAWGILDAQYFGLAQRRERVFVVGSRRGWTDSAAILFDRESMSGNPTPRRQTGQEIAASLTRGADSSGKGGYAGRRREDDTNIVVNCIDSHMGSGGPDDNAAQGNHLLVGTLNANGKAAGSATQQDAECGMLVAHSLRADGFDASEDGTGRGTPIIPILEIGKGSSSRGDGPNGCGIGNPGDPMFTLQSGAQHAIAFQERSRAGGRAIESQSDVAYSLNNPGDGGRRQEMNWVTPSMAVRRLTPRECERLQGFPDDFTAIPFRGKPAADGPRYRALGNSMAVPVLKWIGHRIEAINASETLSAALHAETETDVSLCAAGWDRTTDRRIRNPQVDVIGTGENGVIDGVNEDSSVVGPADSLPNFGNLGTGSARTGANTSQGGDR
jgi:DNA (cytosine-5)-methyltransferase 1